MKYTFWGFGLIMAGIFGIVFIVMFQSITIDNESEYYVLKEAMEAAMLESVDVTCYRSDETEGCGGVVKISEQKFVENFTRRFISSVSGDVTQYEIEFYDIIESPPKASVVIKGRTKNYNILAEDGSASFDIVNSLDGILIYDYVHERGEISVDTDIILSVDDPISSTETVTRAPVEYEDPSPACIGDDCVGGVVDENEYIIQDEIVEDVPVEDDIPENEPDDSNDDEVGENVPGEDNIPESEPGDSIGDEVDDSSESVIEDGTETSQTEINTEGDGNG